MASPITNVASAEQQHLLFLFIPVKKHMQVQAENVIESLNALVKSAPTQDMRGLTGVHYFLFYLQLEGTTPNLPVPSFQTPPGKHLLVVQAIYDADFAPYIKSFVDNDDIAKGLNGVLAIMDESGIISPDDPTSAAYILANGLVQKNAEAFNCLLMRYNFADPTIPAGVTVPAGTSPKYIFGGTFPGLTVSSILENYPDAEILWPSPPVAMTFDPSYQPGC